MAAPAEPPAALLERVLGQYRAGRFLDAWDAAREAGDPLAWRGARARVLIGRLARHLGAPRRGLSLLLRAARADPQDLEARYFGAYAMVSTGGNLAAWRAVERARRDGHPVDDTADWLGLRASVLAELGDLDLALELSTRALERPDADDWTRVERATVLERADRRAEALALLQATAEATRARGEVTHRAVLQHLAHALASADRREEALAALDAEGPAAALQSWGVACQRAQLLGLLERHDEARAAWEASVALAPLLDLGAHDDEAALASRGGDDAHDERPAARGGPSERGAAQWFAGVRADAAYRAGDLGAALEHARRGSPYHRLVAEHMAAAPPGARRVTLPVPFLRQQRDTCAPTSLAMLCAFWGRPVDHVALAAAICYDGTPGHAERHWAETEGWTVREAVLTWDSARALLDRGVPFCLSLTDVEEGHQIAVHGYDERRGTLLARDPRGPGETELLAAPLVERYRAWGPPILVLAPPGRTDLLAGVPLADAERLDAAHAVDRALEAHDRAAAAAGVTRLLADHPAHPCALRAELALARYDGDPLRAARALEAAVARWPEDPALRLGHARALLAARRTDEARAALERACEAPHPQPAHQRLLAALLADDARQQAEVERILARCRRWIPDDPQTIGLEASLLWSRPGGPDPLALALYRFAATAADKLEGPARTYLLAARALERGAEALAWLESRAVRHGAQSAGPACTLAWAHELGGDLPAAQAALERAQAARPGDPEPTLTLAELLARNDAPRGGEALGAGGARAQRLLEEARPRCAPGRWRRAAARVATAAGEPTMALARWREVVADEPLDVEAQEAIAGLLAELTGEAAGTAHLVAASEAHPHHVALARLACEWLGRGPPERQVAALRALRERGVVDPWVERELALRLVDAGQPAAALEHAELAVAIEPSVLSHGVRGEVLLRETRLDEAAAAFREGLALHLDHPPALLGLVRAARDGDAARRALDWVRAALVAQPTNGIAASAWLELASGQVDPGTLVEQARGLCQARPERWCHARDLVLALRQAGRPEEARDEVERACARFPQRAALWLTRAGLEATPAARRAALARAVALEPTLDDAVRALARAELEAGDAAAAVAWGRRLVGRSPLDPNAQVVLAEALEGLATRLATDDRPGSEAAPARDEALRRFERAVRLAPRSRTAWSILAQAAARLGHPERPAELARALRDERPDEAARWLRLAEVLPSSALEEREAALRRAIELAQGDDATRVDAHDALASALAAAGRWDEAEAACRGAPPGRDGRPPVELRGRAAWLRAARGDLPGAIEAMAAAVADAPDYLWGAQHLVEWSLEAEHREALRHAERLVTLSPGDPRAWTLRAQARLQAGDRERARVDLDRAIAVGPDSPWAPRLRFELDLADRRFDHAEQSAAALERASPLEGLAAAVQLAAARRRRAPAEDALRRLIRRPDEPGLETALERGCAALDGLARASTAQLLDEALAGGELPRLSPAVGVAWGRRRHELPGPPGDAQLERLLGAGSTGVAAVAVWIETNPHGPLPELIRRHGDALRRDDRTWGAVTYALLERDDPAWAARWSADWAARPEAPGWALANVANALRRQRRLDEARRANLEALRRAPPGGLPIAEAWAALEAAQAGDPAPSAALGPLQGYAEAVGRLARARGALARGAPLAEVRTALDELEAAAPWWRRDDALSAAHGELVGAVRRAHGSLAWAWASFARRPVDQAQQLLLVLIVLACGAGVVTAVLSALPQRR